MLSFISGILIGGMVTFIIMLWYWLNDKLTLEHKILILKERIRAEELKNET